MMTAFVSPQSLSASAAVEGRGQRLTLYHQRQARKVSFQLFALDLVCVFSCVVCLEFIDRLTPLTSRVNERTFSRHTRSSVRM